MGSCPCSKGPSQVKLITVEVKSPDWAKALGENNITAIKIMHANDPGLINEPIDEFGSRAIHLAVQHKNGELMDYLLQNPTELDCKGGEAQNTPLHLAVLNKDLSTVRKLFSFNVSDTLTNREGKTALELCHRKFRREYLKAKKFRKNHESEFAKKRLQKQHSAMASSEGIMLAGMDLRTTQKSKWKAYEKETSTTENYFKTKEYEIENRETAVTDFGESVGVDVDEIAMALQKIESKGGLWKKLAKKPMLTKQTEIYKVLYPLSLLALRRKNPKARKPQQKPIRNLTVRMCKKLPKKRGKTLLTQEMFEKKFHTMLFEIHDEMRKDEEDHGAMSGSD